MGIIPGAGGTQRLPRLIGTEAAIEVITSGRHIPAEEALAMGAIDEIVEGDLVEAACAAALRLAEAGGPPSRTGDRSVDPKTVPDGVFDAAKAKLAKRRRGFEAPPAAIDAFPGRVQSRSLKGLGKSGKCQLN